VTRQTLFDVPAFLSLPKPSGCSSTYIAGAGGAFSGQMVQSDKVGRGQQQDVPPMLYDHDHTLTETYVRALRLCKYGFQ